MELNKEELEAVVDLIDVALQELKLGRGVSNKLRSAQFKMMLEAKLIIFKEGMKHEKISESDIRIARTQKVFSGSR